MAVVVSSVIFATDAARAQVEAIRLTYGAYPGCPSESRFHAEVTARTERARRVTQDEPARTFVVAVSPEANGVRGILVVTSLDGAVSKREIAGDTCSEVVSALALVTALAIDPAAATEPGPRLGIQGLSSDDTIPGASPAGASESSSLEPPSVPSAPAAREAGAVRSSSPRSAADLASGSGRRVRWAIGAEGQTLAALVPGWGFGAGPFVEAAGTAGGHLVPSLRASVFAATTTVTFTGEIGARLDWLVARLEGCPLRFSWATDLTFVLCAALDAGVLQSTGTGLKTSATEIRPWLSPGAIGRLAWSWPGSFFIEGGAGLTTPLTHYSFHYQQAATSGGPVHTIPLVGVVADAGAGYRFP
jgi:hypothetical protein